MKNLFAPVGRARNRPFVPRRASAHRVHNYFPSQANRPETLCLSASAKSGLVKCGPMRVKNYTKFNTDLIREIIAFVRPPGISNFDISFKNSECGWKGRAYWAGCSYHDRRSAPYVTVGVPARTTEATRYKKPNITDFGKGYLRSVQFSPVEDMVHLIAHELRHLWQAKVKKGHRVWGARGQFSERDADAYAIRMVRQWRRRP